MPLKGRRNVRELALFQLCFPENGVHIVETVVDPAFLFDMVQVDETTLVSITVHCGKNAPTTKLEGLLFS